MEEEKPSTANPDDLTFNRELIQAGYKKHKSEDENQILRKYNLSRDDHLSDDKNRVYTDNSSGKAYVLYPGTKDWADVGTDVALLFGMEKYTPRFRKGKDVAKKVSEKYGKGNVTAIGHSLGGALATESGVQKRITFNKGVGIGGIGKQMRAGQVDYRTKKDVVSLLSTTQKHKAKGFKQWNRGGGLLDAHKTKYLF